MLVLKLERVVRLLMETGQPRQALNGLTCVMAFRSLGLNEN